MSTMAGLNHDVVSAAAGDRQAFVRIVEASANTVTSIAISIVRDIHASQDIAQEVFLVTWRDIRKLQNPASFLPWIRQITRNRANEWLRQQRFDRTEREAEEILATAVDRRPIPSDVVEADEQQRVVNEIIDSLPDDAREVITLFYKEGRSVKQVASLLGLSEDAVKKRLSRARERIREDLLDRFGEVVRRSAPAAAIDSLVAASIVTATPAAAAATSMTVMKIAGTSLAAKIFAALGGTLAGAFLGIAGVHFGVKKAIAAAIDDRELQELTRFGKIASAVVAAAAMGIGLSGYLESPALLIVTQTLFVISLSWMYLLSLPRITARRRAAELVADPGAAARHRRAKITSYLGLSIGVSLSTAAVIMAVLKMLKH